jgi:hypothetical protein
LNTKLKENKSLVCPKTHKKVITPEINPQENDLLVHTTGLQKGTKNEGGCW